MHNVVLMHEVQCLQHVLHDTDGNALLIYLSALDPLKELSSIKVTEHQMNVLVTFIHLVQLDDEWML